VMSPDLRPRSMCCRPWRGFAGISRPVMLPR
jgi:hypothetical protein